MKKCKIFSCASWKYLENEVNKWLAVNNHVHINEMQYQHSHDLTTSEYVCIIIYYDKSAQ
jgi:hypothetical protein